MSDEVRAIHYRAAIHSMRTDADGETFVTYRIPLSDLPAGASLKLFLKKDLFVTTELFDETGGRP